MNTLFPEFISERAKLKAKFQGLDYKKNYDYYADEAEAVVYIITQSGINPVNCLYVMKRRDAVAFCQRPETASNNGNRSWAFMFTTYKTDWREDLDSFRRDDGRFDKLLEELGITPIYVKSKCQIIKDMYANEGYSDLGRL